jgi:hypothetical protein
MTARLDIWRVYGQAGQTAQAGQEAPHEIAERIARIARIACHRQAYRPGRYQALSGGRQ